MIRAALVVLLGALAACRKPAPPAVPTVAAMGAELATYRQVFVPLSQDSWIAYNEAAKRKGAANVTETSFPLSYLHTPAAINDKETPGFVAYSSPWQAQRGAPLRPMSILQFLRAFASDEEAGVAMLNTPKGAIVFSRSELVDIIGGARTAGASAEELPFALIRGSGKP